MSRPSEIASEITESEWRQIVSGDATFDEIKAKYGEEVAIYAGIARDPDAPEWTTEDFARARAAEYRRTHNGQRAGRWKAKSHVIQDLGSAGVFEAEPDGHMLTVHLGADSFVDDQTGSVWNMLGLAVSGLLA